MRFRQHQDQARWATRRLLLIFVLVVALTVVCINVALALMWRLQVGGLFGYPKWFFETNTAITLLFILGGCWVETLQLREGGARVAEWVGGVELVHPNSFQQKRLLNIVHEMALASGLKVPRVFVLQREDAINAFAAGWEQQDSVVAVTRGALERLTRDELQGVVAHEFGHILNGDTRLNMRLIGYVYGLQMIFNLGRSLASPSDIAERRGAGFLIGLALMAVGSISWMAGRLLKAAVSRQREHLADAYAVQFTRLPDGIGSALRKIAGQMQAGHSRLAHAQTETVSHMLLSSNIFDGWGALATHPSLRERLRRIYGRAMPPLPSEPVPDEGGTASAAPLPPLDFVPVGSVGLAGAARPSAFAVPDAAPRPTAPAPALATNAAELPLQRLPDLCPPGQLQAAVLAFLVPKDGPAEHALWRQATVSVADASQVLAAVQSLPTPLRQPWFDRVRAMAAALPESERAALRQHSVQLVKADGQLALHEYLAAMLIHHDLSPRPEHLASEQRSLRLDDVADAVVAVTCALAAALPESSQQPWLQAVLHKLELPAHSLQASLRVDAPRQLSQAMHRIRCLALLQKPQLVKAWVAHAPLTSAMADALRATCLLIDAPMPPALANCFDTVGELR